MFFFISLSHIIRWKSATFSNFIIAKAPRAVAPSASAAVWQEWRTAALPHPVPSPGSLVRNACHQPQEPWRRNWTPNWQGSFSNTRTLDQNFTSQSEWKKNQELWLKRPRNLSNLQNLIHPPLCRRQKKRQVSDIQEAADGPARDFGRRHVEGLAEWFDLGFWAWAPYRAP